MNNEQIKDICERIGTIWPEWSPVKRQNILKEKLFGYPYAVMSEIVGELSEWHSKAPSLADFVQEVKKHKPASTGQVCSNCENTGWIFVDQTGRGTVKRCGCGLGETQPCTKPGFTSEGHPVATAQEKHDAIIRGYLKYKPDATEQEIEVHLARFGVKRNIDIF